MKVDKINITKLQLFRISARDLSFSRLRIRKNSNKTFFLNKNILS